MKIGIQTWGSDGDILPFIALAKGLRDSGHEVTLVYTSVDNKDYSLYGESFDITLIKAYEKFSGELSKIFAEIVKTKDPLTQLSLTFEHYFIPAVGEMYAASQELCLDNDLVIGHGIHYPLATAAEKLKRPRVSVVLCPVALETKYTSPLGINFGKWLNMLFWKLGDRLSRKKLFQEADNLRKTAGLPPFKNLQDDLYVTKELMLIAASKVLSLRQPDWGSNIQICGFLNPPDLSLNWKMPEGLSKFLETGEPPVFFTFGSCTQLDLEGTTQLFLDATEKSGVRAIIQSDWDNFPEVSDEPNIFKVTSIPHDNIFRYCSMVVHHGGAGTTQSTLKAGKAAIIVEHGFDQPFWGKRLHNIGVAGKVLNKRTVSANKLAKSILNVLDTPDMSKKAQDISRTIREENGVGSAVSMIEEKFS
jgi:sterol 3beta-glucosyltransferase